MPGMESYLCCSGCGKKIRIIAFLEDYKVYFHDDSLERKEYTDGSLVLILLLMA